MKPKVNQEHIDRVKLALSSGRWRKGRDLAKIPGINTRMIRAVAEETGEIISCQKGYKLIKYATDSEVRIARADLLSRAAHIQKRADRLHRELLVRTSF